MEIKEIRGVIMNVPIKELVRVSCVEIENPEDIIRPIG